MSETEKKPLSMSEWLDAKIEDLLQVMGRIDTLYGSMTERDPFRGTYSWLQHLVAEILEIYRVQKLIWEKEKETFGYLRTILGLEKGAPSAQVAERANELRDFFNEMRRIRAERENRNDGDIGRP